MSLQSYGLLKCKAIGMKEERDDRRPHYQIHAIANEDHYRISINIKSDFKPSELLFYKDDNFSHSIINNIKELPFGFFASQSICIDYVRGNLGFSREDMKTIPHDRPGPNNDINEKLNFYIKEAILKEESELYVFGTRWKSRNRCKADRVFGFQPSVGMHDIHMNQGNTGKWKKDDGVWQDGCLLIHYPLSDKWVGIFLAFQSQSWNTDDCTGHAKKK